jgi:PII-like signaling protein
MGLNGHSRLLRVFVGEIDKIHHHPLYEAIVLEARKEGIAGATVLRGIMSYGASSRIHSARLIDISEDLPIVIEIVDTEEKIDQFIPKVQALMEQCGRGGLITIEQVNVLFYEPRK